MLDFRQWRRVRVDLRGRTKSEVRGRSNRLLILVSTYEGFPLHVSVLLSGQSHDLGDPLKQTITFRIKTSLCSITVLFRKVLSPPAIAVGQDLAPEHIHFSGILHHDLPVL